MKKGHTRVSRNYDAIVPLRIAGETAKYLSTRRIWQRRKNGSVCAPSLNRPLDQNGNVVLDDIVYLSLRIAHNAKYSDLVLAVSCRLEHARFELTHRLEWRSKRNLWAMMVKETTITVLRSFLVIVDGHSPLINA